MSHESTEGPALSEEEVKQRALMAATESLMAAERRHREAIDVAARTAAALERIALAVERLSPPWWPAAIAPDTSAVPCEHVYPNPWHGIWPPRCQKCGQ